MISWLASMGTFVPLDMVYRVYFRNSPIVKGFGFSEQIPTWWVPPPETGVQIMRTFFHPSWFTPFALYIAFFILSYILGLALGLLLRELYITVEKLPFPLQQVHAQQIITQTYIWLGQPS